MIITSWIDTWAVASQLRARRNAMIAATELAQRRAETQEVEAFLASRRAPERIAAHG